nr:MAG TPA: Oligo alginate lyase [Caudoviricetes sp.]
MATLTMYANQSAKISASYPTTNYSDDTVVNDGNLLVSFSGFPLAAQFKKIILANIFLYATLSGSTAQNISGSVISFLAESFAEKSVTYQTRPKTSINQAKIYDYVSSAKYVSADVSGIYLKGIPEILQHGIQVSPPYGIGFQTSRGSNKPYVTVEYSDNLVGLSLSALSPNSGAIVAANATVFSWAETADGVCYADIARSSAKFRWRKSASDTVKEIAVSGTATSITIPANTFSGDSIQWQLSVTANSGVTTTSDWMTLSLTDVESTAVAVAPDRAVLDGASDNVFKWDHVISTGTAQTKAELQQSTDGSTWTALATVTGAATTWTALAGTFTSGTKYWRVRTYNSKGAAGAWSAATQFIVLAAPATPPVSIVSTEPRPEIRWQSDEQQAYQVEIDGVYASGTRFGTGKTWKAPFYLADGSYTVRVRVQNEYGFWSPWGTAALPVTNVPGSSITLTAEGGIEAALSWTPGSFDYYLVYRDGVAIAKVTEPSYTDAASIGVVRYQVRGCYDNSDNYSLSEAVEVTVSTDKVRLYDMERGEWLHFLYDSSAHRSTGLSLSQDIQYVQLSGHTYPVAERSEFKSRALRITCVCADDAERQSLRALLGHLTCCKTPEGNMTIGYPASISESSDDFFSTYSFTIEQIDRKEEIDLDS